MKINFKELASNPIVLEQNRVWRTYTGGKLLDEFKNNPSAVDSSLPEEWIASDTNAQNKGREFLSDEGLTKIKISSGLNLTLKRLIEEESEKMMGEKHYKIYGKKLALLNKLLDSSIRLSLQVHPTNEFAQKNFNSPFGKTEAWIILNTRKINGVDPYLLLGFKKGITKKEFKKMFEEQDIEGIINSMHKITPEVGSCYYIPGGLPHAIGPGCFLMEIQEPTDYTIRVEKTSDGKKIPDELCHQGLGYEKALETFEYQGYSLEEIESNFVKKTLKAPSSKTENHIDTIFSKKDTNKFKVDKVTVLNSANFDTNDCYYIAVITEGAGKIITADKEIEVKKGDNIFMPAAVGKHRIESKKKLEFIKSAPPSVYK